MILRLVPAMEWDWYGKDIDWCCRHALSGVLYISRIFGHSAGLLGVH